MPTTEDSPKLTWPPTKEDLQRLYVEQRLSAAKIAKVYQLNTPNPKSAVELVRYHLKRNGIERRNRIQELCKETEATVTVWKEKHPKQESPDMEVEESAVLELLGIKNLSVRHLDPETKERVRAMMERLHWTEGLSLNGIADLIDGRTSGDVSRWFKDLKVKARPFEVSRLKSIMENRKYERRPFDGTDEDKAYLLGIAHGDFHVRTPWNGAVSVSTSTTHPAMVQLFRKLFSPFGHVYQFSRYQSDVNSYEWNLQATLDDTFRFLLVGHKAAWEWVSQDESRVYSYLAGLWDAEGRVGIQRDAKVVSVHYWCTTPILIC